MIIVIGIAMVILLTDIRRNQDLHIRQAVKATVATCRIAIALHQEVQPDGPCAEPQIEQLLKELPITTIGTEENDIKTQSILCEFMGRTAIGVPTTCKD